MRKGKSGEVLMTEGCIWKHIVRFALPLALGYLFQQLYTTVDSIVVGNYVGKEALAAVGTTSPIINTLIGFFSGLATGGSVVIAKNYGAGNAKMVEKAVHTAITVILIFSVFATVLGVFMVPYMLNLMSTPEDVYDEAEAYLQIYFAGVSSLMIYNMGSAILRAVGDSVRPLCYLICSSFVNVVFDIIFVKYMSMGVAGAALATGISQCVGGIVPFVWFLSKKNKSALRFTKTKFEPKPMIKACVNGSSEMMTSVSASVTGILYNLQLMKYAGEDGVAAYGVVMYAAFIFIGIFAGYSSGASPVMGYHYGAANHKEMKNILRKSIIMLAITAAVLTVCAVLLARPISALFVGYDAELLKLTSDAFVICALPFLVMWLNMYASSFFTALNDGAVSAAISFLRSLVLPVICILVFPRIWQLDGVWYALAGSEFLSTFISLAFMIGKRKKYGY